MQKFAGEKKLAEKSVNAVPGSHTLKKRDRIQFPEAQSQGLRLIVCVAGEGGRYLFKKEQHHVLFIASLNISKSS